MLIQMYTKHLIKHATFGEYKVLITRKVHQKPSIFTMFLIYRFSQLQLLNGYGYMENIGRG